MDRERPGHAAAKSPEGVLSLVFGLLGPLQEAARSVGITLAQAALLVALASHGEMTAGEIGRALGTTSGPVTSLTARLLTRRLIRKRPDPADLRSVLFAMTEEGGRVLRAYREAVGDRVVAP